VKKKGDIGFEERSGRLATQVKRANGRKGSEMSLTVTHEGEQKGPRDSVNSTSLENTQKKNEDSRKNCTGYLMWDKAKE